MVLSRVNCGWAKQDFGSKPIANVYYILDNRISEKRRKISQL